MCVRYKEVLTVWVKYTGGADSVGEVQGGADIVGEVHRRCCQCG